MSMMVLLSVLIIMFAFFMVGGVVCDFITEVIDYDREVHQRRKSNHEDL